MLTQRVGARPVPQIWATKISLDQDKEVEFCTTYKFPFSSAYIFSRDEKKNQAKLRMLTRAMAGEDHLLYTHRSPQSTF